MLLNFKRIDFMHEMKNFPWQFGLTLSEKGKFFSLARALYGAF